MIQGPLTVTWVNEVRNMTQEYLRLSKTGVVKESFFKPYAKRVRDILGPQAANFLSQNSQADLWEGFIQQWVYKAKPGLTWKKLLSKATPEAQSLAKEKT